MPAGRGFRAITLAGVLAATAVLASAGTAQAALPAPVPCAGPSCWAPEPTTEPWQWQLQGKIDLSVPAPVYDIE